MLRRLLAGIVLLGATPVASATDLDINLGDDVAEIGLSQTLGTRQASEIRAGGAFLFNDDDDLVGSGFLHVLTQPGRGRQPLTFGAGAKVFAADLDNADTTVGALGLGGSVRLEAPSPRLPLAVTLSGHFAPDIVTSGSGEGVNEVVSRIEARLAPAATVYAGYRYLEVELDGDPDREVDDDFHLGLRLTF